MMDWTVKHEMGTAYKAEGKVDFWVCEMGSLGFACYSEEAAIEAARILNQYQKISNGLSELGRISLERPMAMYGRSTGR